MLISANLSFGSFGPYWTLVLTFIDLSNMLTVTLYLFLIWILVFAFITSYYGSLEKILVSSDVLVISVLALGGLVVQLRRHLVSLDT